MLRGLTIASDNDSGDDHWIEYFELGIWDIINALLRAKSIDKNTQKLWKDRKYKHEITLAYANYLSFTHAIVNW